MKIDYRKQYKNILVPLLLLLSLASFMIKIIRCSDLYVIAYGFSDHKSSAKLLDKLSSMNIAYKFYDLLDSSNDSTINRGRFLEIISIINALGIPILPPDICLSCYLQHGIKWEDLLLAFDTPILAFFREGELTAISIALVSEEDLAKILAAEPSLSITIYTIYGEYRVEDVEARIKLSKSLLGEQDSSIIPSKLLMPIVSLAIADSVNPCTFLLYTALLLLALSSIGRSRAFIVGLSFIIAVFLGYYALGLGLSIVMPAIPYLKYIVGSIGILAGFWNILRGMGRGFKPNTPKAVREFAYRFAGIAYLSPVISFILGLMVSFTLLPCSGGPYFVALSFITAIRESVWIHVLLLLYNTIFVIPLLSILLLTIMSERYIQGLAGMRSIGRMKLMQVISGLILIPVSIYLIVF